MKIVKYFQKIYIKKLNIFFIVWLSVGIILSFDLYDGFNWSKLSYLSSDIVMTRAFSSIGITPLKGLIFITLNFYAVTMILNLAMIIIYHISHRRSYLIVTSIIIFLESIIMIRMERYIGASFIINIFKFPIYIVSTKVIMNFNNIRGYLRILACIYITLICLNNIYSNRQRIKNKIDHKWIYVVYVISIIISMVIQLRKENILDMTILDGIFFSFYGITNKNGYFLNLLKYIMTFWGGVYFAQLSFDKEIKGNLHHKIIRYGTVHKWFFHWIKGTMIYLIGVLTMLFICSIVISYFLVDYKTILESNVFYNLTMSKIVYQFFINGFLQLLLYVLFVVTIAWKTKNTFASLTGLFFTMIFMLPEVNKQYLFPSSLNSLGFLVEGNMIFRNTIILLIYIAINISILQLMFTFQDIK